MSPVLRRRARWAAAAAGGLPGAWLLWAWWAGRLGVVPDETLLHLTGRFALALLVLTLAMGPIFALTRWQAIAAMRRPLGLWVFGYALAHLWVWAVLDQGGQIAFIAMELASMAHLQLGLAALLLMLPLAVTSTDGAVRRLGMPWWRRLHLLVWPAALIAVVHGWMVARFGNPLVAGLGAVVCLLLLARIGSALRSRGG